MNAARLERKVQELVFIGFNYTTFVSVDHYSPREPFS
jgi:hypothetical protein